MWQAFLINIATDKKTWIGVGVITFLIIFYLWASQDSDKRKDDRAEREIKDDALSLGLDPRDIKFDARGIVNALGIEKPWYDPTGWTENEEAVIRILQNYTRESYPVLQEAYYQISNRPLTSDLFLYLEDGDLQPVLHIIQ